jgi:hypothetical protein
VSDTVKDAISGTHRGLMFPSSRSGAMWCCWRAGVDGIDSVEMMIGGRCAKDKVGSSPLLKVPITRCALIALAATKVLAERGHAARFRQHPGAIRPGRIVANMLVVPTCQLGDPVLFVVLVKADDRLFHAGACRHA